MEDVSITYWATLAQVMPIVALGIVVEARGISATWDLDTPTALKALQSGIWAVMLAVLAFGESKAISALRGVDPADYWSPLCENSISSGLGVLVLAPALEFLVKAYAVPLAGLVSFHPIWRARIWRLDRIHKRLDRRLDMQEAKYDSLLAQMESTLAEGEALLAGHEKALAEIEALPVDHELSSEELERRTGLADTIAEIRRFIDEEREALTQARAKKEEERRSREEQRAEFHAQRQKHSVEIEESRRQERTNLATYLATHRTGAAQRDAERAKEVEGDSGVLED